MSFLDRVAEFFIRTGVSRDPEQRAANEGIVTKKQRLANEKFKEQIGINAARQRQTEIAERWRDQAAGQIGQAPADAIADNAIDRLTRRATSTTSSETKK